MAKKVKTMEELLEKVNISKLKEVGVNPQEIAKVEALHNLLKQGKTWEDDEVQQLFGVLPDSFPFCTAFVHNEVLIRIGKCKPIKVVSRPGIKDSRLKWVPVEKSEEFNVPAQISIKGYEIICAQCHKTFIGKEPFHQNFCSKCSGRKTREPEPATTPEPVKSAMVEPVVSLSTKPDKPKRRGRPPKNEEPKKRRGRPPKSETQKKPSKRSKKSEKATSSRPTKEVRKRGAKKQKK